MARSVVHFLDAFPAATLKPGDVLITNDPWKGTGHLFDLTVVTPVFLGGRGVALFACTTHVVDIGGLGSSAEGRQVYHEGLYIPLMHLAREGRMNDDLLNIVRANVREPVQVVGDIYALVACNEKGGQRLLEMMASTGSPVSRVLGEQIVSRSRRAMAEVDRQAAARELERRMTIDGFEAPVTLAATLTIGEDRVLVDFAGTFRPVGLRHQLSALLHRCLYGLRREGGARARIPNNTGTLDAIVDTAPENTIVNAPHPAAVYATLDYRPHAARRGLWLPQPGHAGDSAR